MAKRKQNDPKNRPAEIGAPRAVCPCCGALRNVVKETSLIAQDKTTPGPWWLASQEQLVRMAQGKHLESPVTAWIRFQWACNSCLRSGRALRADTTRQKFFDSAPYYAYFDLQHRCEDCGRTFVFSAREQKFWYEVKQFWVMSRPKQCPACRKKRRAIKRARNDLNDTIASLDPNDPIQLLRVASLHRDLGNTTSADKFFRQSRNRAAKQKQANEWSREAMKLGWQTKVDE